MSSVMDNVQPAVKKETQRVAAITGIGLILMDLCLRKYHLIIRYFLEVQSEDVWQS